MNPEKRDLANAFGAPIYHLERTESTMADARILAKAADGSPDGTAVYADFQSAGRGRIEGRVWESNPAENLLCTVLLRRAPVTGFTLRVGLAVARAFDAFLPPGAATSIKWPNDVVYAGKKIAGVLCENDGSTLYVGTGLNIAQRVFPPELGGRAGSLAGILDDLARVNAHAGRSSGDADDPCIRAPLPTREAVLERYLAELKSALETDTWREDIEAKLWKRGERIRFLAGDPGRNEYIDGAIEGIGAAGELLFRPAERGEPATTSRIGELRRIFSGEIPLA
jgi:BirA family biotin operon repressor/biotin-[acetyl-CoA-carboxylase] ligase